LIAEVVDRPQEINELIEYFNNVRAKVLYEDRTANPWEALAKNELEWITDEIFKCASDFRYAAFNYFWLGQTKQRKPALFKLWTVQEYFLSVIEALWAQGKPAWVIIHKCRQIGASTVCEALMAWKNIFFEHQISAIIAQDPKQAEHLLKITLYIIDHLPWWLRPMEQSREFKEAMILENPDPDQRSYRSGLDNWIIANGCNKTSSFMQGKPIANLHASEVSSWDVEKALEILQGDTKWGLLREPGCMAVLESKPKGVTGYWYNLWHVYEGQGVDAEYFPFYVPCFFEKSRQQKPPADWQPNDEMVEVRETYAKDWKGCSECGTPIRTQLGMDFCLKCGSEKNEPIFLTDAQLYWYYVNKKAAEDLGEEELRLFFQEMPVVPEQGFQHSGITVFPADVLFRVQKTAKPGTRGFFDDQYQFHSAKNCRICKDDHFVGSADKNIIEEFPLQIWELPQDGAKYVCGVDVAEGQEEGDFSCIHVLKIGYGLEYPDTQVAEWHGHIDAIEFARVCYVIGKAYNTGMLAIDAFGPGYGTQGIVMHQYGYPEVYRWKHLDNVTRLSSNKAGVWPNYKTRRTMIAVGIRWLRKGIWVVKSPRFLEEVPFFVKDEEDAKAEALQGHFDDCIMAALYAIYAAHEDDYNPKTARFDIPMGAVSRSRDKIWRVTCCRGHVFDADDPKAAECPTCKKEDPERRTLVKMATKKVDSTITLASSLIARAESPGRPKKPETPFEWL
jgi:hypothetical protein